MELCELLGSLGDIGFEEKRKILSSPPYHLEIREEGDLYNVIFSDASPQPEQLSFMRNCVGAIFEKASDRLVSYTFDRTTEIRVDPHSPTSVEDALQKLAAEDIGTCSIAPYVEGAKLTLYHHASSWRLATSRMIDAYKAFWNRPKSFGEHFEAACVALYPALWDEVAGNTGGQPGNVLDPAMCYTFILSVPEEKGVVPVTQPCIFHINTVRLEDVEAVDVDLGVVRPAAAAFSSFEDMIESTKAFSFWHPGYIVRGKAGRYKVLTEKYMWAKELRGNTPNVERNYLELRKDVPMRQEFLSFYPEHFAAVAKVEADLTNVARLLHRLYVQHFVAKVPRPHYDKTIFITLMQIHTQYRETREKRTVALIRQLLETLPVHVQLRLLKIVPLTVAGAAAAAAIRVEQEFDAAPAAHQPSG